MKPDLLTCWIKHCDYPLFRQKLKEHRHRFGKVIVLFSEHNRFPYFDHFIHESLKDLDITFLDPAQVDWGNQDWRDIATNHMLKYSDSEWVCSIEQDWFAKDWPYMLDATMKALEDCDLFGWWQENNKYIHPAYWFARRSMLDKTDKDFSAHGKHDHFGWITEGVRKAGGRIDSLQDHGFNCNVDIEAYCFHLGGVNQNYLEGMNEGFVFHRPQIFSVYNQKSTECPVRQDPRHLDLCHKIADKLPVPMGWGEFF